MVRLHAEPKALFYLGIIFILIGIYFIPTYTLEIPTLTITSIKALIGVILWEVAGVILIIMSKRPRNKT